jgi:hypothetical protein
MGKVFKKITKPIQKLIPKEIKPFLPALAAVFGPAAFAGTGIFSSAALASLPVGVQAAIASGLTSTLTEGKPDLKSAALSGIMSQAGSSLKGYGNLIYLKEMSWDQILKIFYKKQLLLLVNIYNQVLLIAFDPNNPSL